MSFFASELISREPPGVLYHYTTQSGLIGILVKDDEIWATHTQYLNDRREFIHASDLVRDEIGRRQGVAKSRSGGARESVEILEQMRLALDRDIARINVCVCSFSEDGDSLAQWRAYGDATSGFALGFHGEFLSRLAAREECLLAPCVYDAVQQQRLVSLFVDKIYAEILAHRPTSPTDEHHYHWTHGGNLVAALNGFAPLIKDHSFRDEKEWRLITRPLACTQDRFEYRVGKSMIVPYYRIPLGNTPDGVGKPRISRVLVGPTPYPEQSKWAVESVLAKLHLRSSFTSGGPVQVDNSTVPYRAW